MSHAEGSYYLPSPSHWPIVGSIGMFIMLFGFASSLPTHNDGVMGSSTMTLVGLAIIIFMLFGWFGVVIKESEAGAYNEQVDVSFRMGMMWFIFSEVMFFAAFFGALYYARHFSVPWLGGEGNNAMTNELLYKGFEGTWPTSGPGKPGEGTSDMVGAVAGKFTHIPWQGIPLLNTILLLSSGVTLTFAHWALKKESRKGLMFWLLATVVLGFVFLYYQVWVEYPHAYHLGTKLTSGIYGTTFYMLTGFHGFHVFLGATILTVILLRSVKGHFSAKHHFAFEAAAWYWHFVDVVWLGLFIFVYIL